MYITKMFAFAISLATAISFPVKLEPKSNEVVEIPTEDGRKIFSDVWLLKERLNFS
ncbi:hypothetical protein M7I_6687 [Glarea lozoyensis 74030]|uniref:Uncharacterized protein n=1 Tax=Glarea lozoyensis (strain ATCC 74030 / MF5533) TaxID=1104152 RepID=H0EV92_GLAL7|nr:hypothetical protein M7I_6687 [Glarea lozoyensis 74030]